MPGPDDFGGAFGGAAGGVAGIIASGLNAIGSALRGGPGFSNSRFLRDFARQIGPALDARRGTAQTPNVPAPYVPPSPPAPYLPPTQPGAPGGPLSGIIWQEIINKAREDSARLMRDTEAEKAKRAEEKAKKRAAKKAANEARQKKIDAQKKRAEEILAKRAGATVPRGGSRGAVGRGRAPWEPKVERPSSPPGGGAAGTAPPITVIVNIPGPGTGTGSGASSGQKGPKETKLERIKVTARYQRLPNRTIKIPTLPKTAPVPGGLLGKYPILGKILSAGTLLSPLSSLVFPVGAPKKGRRSDPLTASQQQVVPFAQSSPAFFMGGGTPTKTKTCECKPKKRKKGPKKRRTVCYRGTYYETPTGTRKRKREQIPCEAIQ